MQVARLLPLRQGIPKSIVKFFTYWAVKRFHQFVHGKVLKVIIELGVFVH